MDKEKKMFVYDLVKRFVSDYKLPIPVINDTYELFHYYLSMYETEYKALSKWKKLVGIIEEHYEGRPHLFLEAFYNCRERMIQYLNDNPALKEFNAMDMNRYAIPNRPKVTSKNIYNGEAVGKCFISVDLTKANYQAMKYANPEIVGNTDNYTDFIRMFNFPPSITDYFMESKYLRQVVFGNVNPKRQITVETYMTQLIWEEWQRLHGNDDRFEIVSFSNDEFVVKVSVDCEITTELVEIVNEFPVHVKQTLGFEVKANLFGIEQWNLVPTGDNKHSISFYAKESVNTCTSVELMCLPLNYRAIATKLMNGEEVMDEDYYFQYEKYKARLCETFRLVRGKWPFDGKKES